MARLRGVATSEGEIATGTAAKTLIQLVAPTNHKVVLEGFGVSFDGVSSTAAPIQVVLIFQTSAGTMTSGTPVKSDGGTAETLLTTSNHTATAEPTDDSEVIRRWNVHPQGGIDITFDLDEIILGGGDRLGLVVTAAATVNANAYMKFEE